MNGQTLSAEQIIQLLGLQPLPAEGGLYRETYLSNERITGIALPERYQGQDRHFGSAIFYLLTSDLDSFSALHRLQSDEIYHFYLGDPLELTLLFPDGSAQQVILGQNLFEGQKLQFVVPKGVWQGSRVVPGGRYALVGTTMAPGFSFQDFEVGNRFALLEQYPEQEVAIRSLTRTS
jgi:uncharacterized protein